MVNPDISPPDEAIQEAIAVEQVKVYLEEANEQGIAGMGVFALLIFVVSDKLPMLAWAPFAGTLALITLIKCYFVFRYQRNPNLYSTRTWGLSQTLCGLAAGICWGGFAYIAITNIPIEYRLFVLTVVTVVCATASSEGFSFTPPPIGFIVPCLLPVTLWLLIVPLDKIQGFLGLMLVIFMPLSIIQCIKRNRIFVEAQRLRITNQYLAEELSSQHVKLDDARRKAENATRAKSEFLANMSHEIRTPLNGVLGMAQIALKHPDDPSKIRQYMGRILTSGRLLLGVINDILDFSKIEAGKLTVESLPLCPATIMEDNLELVREQASAKGLTLITDISPTLPKACYCDPLRLAQVLINLLSNAVKFTAQGHITLAGRLADDTLCFQIRDTGIGMTQEQADRVFSPFEQADASTTRHYGGTGLGLTITKRIVEALGGTITITSTPGLGSCFEVRLPYRPADPALLPQPETPGEIKESPLAGIRVLVAEDNQVNQLVIEELLLDEGATVVMAASGVEVLELIAMRGAADFDAVLMDIQMPEMDGFTATRHLQAIAPQLPVIGQTANALQEDKAACLAAGMVDHIAKPIERPELIATLRRHLKPSPGA